MKMIAPVGIRVGGKKIEIICMSDVPGSVLLCFTIPSSLIFVYMRSKMRSVRLKLVRVLLHSVNYKHKLIPALGKKNIYFNYEIYFK